MGMAGRSALGKGLGQLFERTTTVKEAENKNLSGTEAGSTKSADSVAINQSPKKVPSKPSPETTQLTEIAGLSFTEISISKIKPNAKQPRQVFDEEAIAELSESIKEIGLLQPIVVRKQGTNFELIMGERRLRASKLAGLKKIPALVKDTEDEQMLRDALLENLHRVQLNPLEEAAAFQQMLDDFGCTQAELAEKVKCSRPRIANTLRLLKLPAPVQRRVAAGVLSAGHARALLSMDDAAAIEKMATRIVAEGLSVRTVEELIALGEVAPESKVRKVSLRPPNPRASELQTALTEILDTKVKVNIGKNRGKIVIEFGDNEDMERVLQALREYR